MKALENFNHQLNDVSVLNENSFLELYPWYYFDTTEKLKKDIITSLTELPKKQFAAFLKYIKEQIQEHHVFDPDESIIQKWLTEFNLNESEFPFLWNENVATLITPIHNDNSLATEKSKVAYSIQRQFHIQAVKLEVIKMIAFIDEMLDENQPITANLPIVNKYPRIFTNENAFNFFERLKDEFGIGKNVLADYSFIFHQLKKEGLIFEHLKVLEFTDFLSEHNIHLDRIKTKSQLGKADLRLIIYNRLKKI